LLLTADGHVKIADFGSVKPTTSTKVTVPPDATSKVITVAVPLAKMY